VYNLFNSTKVSDLFLIIKRQTMSKKDFFTYHREGGKYHSQTDCIYHLKLSKKELEKIPFVLDDGNLIYLIQLNFTK